MQRKSRISELIDDDGNWIGPAHSPEAMRRAERLYREGLIRQQPAGGRVEYGSNDHHGLFFRVRQDEALFEADLITRQQCHRDAEPGRKVDLVEVARDFLSQSGTTSLPDISERGNVIARSTPAQGTSDFQTWLSATANRASSIGFDNSPEVYRPFVAFHETPNFKPEIIARAPTLGTLEETPEYGEIKYGVLRDDGGETFQVRSHTKVFSISRQTMVNSDMRRILLTFNAGGRAAARAEGDAVFNILLNNPTMSDDETLFSSAHANDATPAVPSASELDEMRGLMAAQVGPDGEAINVKPFYLVGPATYESSFSSLRQITNAPDPAGLQSTSHVVTLTDSRLAGQTAWYGIADPMIHEAIAVFTLEDSRRPLIERLVRKPSNAPDGETFRLMHDFVALAVDWRAIARNAGA